MQFKFYEKNEIKLKTSGRKEPQNRLKMDIKEIWISNTEIWFWKNLI